MAPPPMRVQTALSQFRQLKLWTAAATILCFGFPLRGMAAPFDYERAHQKALSDAGFRKADADLNDAYVRAMRKLSRADRAKLRLEERAWIEENARAVQQNSGREVEVLTERTQKRREELERRSLEGVAPATRDADRPTESSQASNKSDMGQPAEAVVANKSGPREPVAPAPQTTEQEKKGPQELAKVELQSGEAPKQPADGWTPKIAANLERVYQKLLKDSEFESADSALRSFYRQAMQVLGAGEREKLRVAEKAWVRQNGMLLQDAGERAEAVLKERTLKRKSELEQMVTERRFQEAPQVSDREVKPAPSAMKPAVALELPVEPLVSKPSAATPAPAPAVVEAKVSADVEEEHEPEHLTEKGFWMFLATWIFGLTALHYRAFRSVQKNPSKELSRELSPVRLYILSACCAGTSLSMLAGGGGVVWMAASVFLTAVGLMVVWYAALAVAVLSRDSADMAAASGPEPASAKDVGH